jgi:hypothetical protein
MALDMNEIEKRLQMASTYRKLLDSKFLDSGEVGELIEAELKEFIHGKLETILGVRPAENQAAYFSGMEVVALKALARKVMSREEETEETPKVVAPVKPEPVVEVKPVAKVATKPVKKTVRTKTTREVKTSPKTEAVAAQTQNIPQASPAAPVANQSLPPNVVVENGRTYEIVDIGGQPFAKDITKQVKSNNAVPTPSKAQYEAMMYTQAMNELSLKNSDPLVAAAISASLGG